MNIQELLNRAEEIIVIDDPIQMSIAYSLLAIAKCLAAKLPPGYVNAPEQGDPVDRGPKWTDEKILETGLPF